MWFTRVVSEGRHQLSSSLHVRTVLVTVLLGAIAFALVGAYLVGQITDGLYDERRKQALSEAAVGAMEAQAVLDGATVQNATDVQKIVDDVLPRLESSGLDTSRQVALLRSPQQDTPLVISNVTSRGLSPSVIPDELREAVRTSQSQMYQPVSLEKDRGQSAPGLAVGSLITVPIGGQYELYFVFDLTPEQETLDFIQGTLLFGAVLFTVLLGGIAWLVARLVVAPIEDAAEASEELAAGNWDKRMSENGDDEFARLAKSFNKMAESLEGQITQLENLSRVQQRFVSDVSHELRTPLTTIRMADDMIYQAREEFDPVISRTAELLHNQVKRFESLLADLLEISRFDAGAARLDAESWDVRELLDKVVDAARPLAERNGTDITISAPSVPCVVEMDDKRIERVLRNLVVNAIEHGEGNPVVITVGGDNDAVAVAVRDHGVGMSEDEVKNAFNRFWRADQARTRVTGGSGLGLAIAMEDTNLHNGWLEAWSDPGHGSNFRLTLPRLHGAELSQSPVPLLPLDYEAPQRPEEAEATDSLEAADQQAIPGATSSVGVETEGLESSADQAEDVSQDTEARHDREVRSHD